MSTLYKLTVHTFHAPLKPYINIIYISPSSNVSLQEGCYIVHVPLSESALSSLFLAPCIDGDSNFNNSHLIGSQLTDLQNQDFLENLMLHC